MKMAAARSAPPEGPPQPMGIRPEIAALCQANRYEEAFTKAVSASNGDVVLFACKNVDTNAVFNGEVSVSQPILFCLMQQLGAVLVTATDPEDIKTIIKWLQEIAVTIDPSNPNIRRHVGAVVQKGLLENINSKMSNCDPAFRRPLQTLKQVIRGKAQETIVSQVLNKARKGGRGAHYRVLGLETNADDSAIKEAYRNLAFGLHPDKNSVPQAYEAFNAVRLAYATLSDAQKRRMYDDVHVGSSNNTQTNNINGSSTAAGGFGAARSSSTASSTASSTVERQYESGPKYRGADGRFYTEAQVTKAYQVALVSQVLKEGGRRAHYRVLGLEYNADVSAIKEAYRELYWKLHPTKNSAPHAHEAFNAVKLAYIAVCATVIQRIFRGHSTRDIHLPPLKRFYSVWKHSLNQVPASTQTFTGWALAREKMDLKRVELLDEDGNFADTDEKLSQALTDTLHATKDAGDGDVEDCGAELDNHFSSNQHAAKAPDERVVGWSQFLVTSHVIKFIRNGDPKYREIFVKRMKQLARGERSHKLQKPLKGCNSIIYEVYLEQKSGFRILWTQEGESIVVWFIAKHKNVSRLARLIDDAKNRTARQQLPSAFVSELGGGSTSRPSAKREILLDALGNVPLKLYDVTFDTIDDIAKASWAPPMHLTEEERKIVEARGTVLLLGRSGTGKTVCICNRMEYDRQRLGHKPNFSQRFVSRSAKLAKYVENAVGSSSDHSFSTFNTLIRELDSLLPRVDGSTVFNTSHHVDFSRFNRDFYAEHYSQNTIDTLVCWRAIRSFLKGSIEAFQNSNRVLSREHFVVSERLGRNRCKIPIELREEIYAIFLHYMAWLGEKMLWDDCDRIVALLKRIEHAKITNASAFEGQIKRGKIYVDEVQDYTQIEILLFFYISGGPGALFLAGDPAQSVVEGTDFRFEEVRSVGHFVAGQRRHLIPEKPKIVNINFRSHAGILNCAGAFLDILFQYFPGSAKQLKKDFGLFRGARPGVFHDVDVQQLSTLLKNSLQGAVILTHDESALRWRDALGHPLVYGIRESKGLEFKQVILLDFFGELPSASQKPWRNLLLQREGPDFGSEHPLVETHLKLVYVAVTRCIEQLFIAETSSTIAGDAAMRWLTSKKSEPTNEQSAGEVLCTHNDVNMVIDGMVMTADEFCIAGIDNAELAESSEIELEQSISYLDRAIYCFAKAQTPDLVSKAKTHRRSIEWRQQHFHMSGSSQDELSTMETEAAELTAALLRENLHVECVNLLAFVAPFLSSYDQQRLEEDIISKIQRAAGM